MAENPKKAIIEVNNLYERILPVYEYAFLRKETDNADSTAQALKDKAMRLYVTASQYGVPGAGTAGNVRGGAGEAERGSRNGGL